MKGVAVRFVGLLRIQTVAACLLVLTVVVLSSCSGEQGSEGTNGGEEQGSSGDAASPLPQQQINAYAFVSDALNGALEIFDLQTSQSQGQQVLITGPDGEVVATYPGEQVVVNYEPTPNKDDWGKVIAQDPPAGTPLDSNTVIIFTVGVPITTTTTYEDAQFTPDLTIQTPDPTSTSTTTTKPKGSQPPPDQLTPP